MSARRLARRGGRLALGIAALLAVGAVAADAKVLYREDLDKERGGVTLARGAFEETPHGKGWRAVYSPGGEQPFQGPVIAMDDVRARQQGDLARGTIVLWIKREERPGQRAESVFSLTDSSFVPIMFVRIHWDWPKLEREIEVGSSPEYPLWGWPVVIPPSGGGGVTVTNHFPIPAISRGQWFSLAFTWGPADSDNAIYFNRQKLKASPRSGFALKRIVQDAAFMLVGAIAELDPSKLNIESKKAPKDAKDLPVVSLPMRSLIDAVEIRDTIDKDIASEFVPDAPVIDAIEHDAAGKAGFSGKLVAGNTLDVRLSGTAGATATYDIAHYPDLDRKIDLDWSGWGVYLEDKVFFEPAEVNLRDVEGYLVYAGKTPFDPAAPGMEPVQELDVKTQKYTLEALDDATPYYFGVVAKMRDGTMRTVIASPMGRPMAETAPGFYAGTWDVTYQDRYPRAVVVGHLSLGTQVQTLSGDLQASFAVDPAVTLAVVTEPSELKADEKSVANVSITATDANGNAVSGHKIKFLLATTSQYTGVVGGGAFAEQVGGALQESRFGETDLFGKISITYVAGFAAKTAVIVARDMASNSTGAGYVKTYIQASASLELEPVQDTAAMDAGYAIVVTSSDEWLTADGKSQAKITARVTLNDVPVEGHKVDFSLSGGGSIRVVKDVTGKDGEARAVYTAGKKIGIVLISATDVDAGISGSVSIELRSDAPAKIAIRLDKDKLPADGRSRAELLVQVTDINDNPNDNTEVEYALVAGSGRLREEKGITDRQGENSTQYTAGRTPGTVTFEITVRSTVPTADEMTKARSLALAVVDSRFF